MAALAATHPPDRVTFLLVDYKGGAAFKDAVSLPHTVIDPSSAGLQRFTGSVSSRLFSTAASAADLAGFGAGGPINCAETGDTVIAMTQNGAKAAPNRAKHPRLPSKGCKAPCPARDAQARVSLDS